MSGLTSKAIRALLESAARERFLSKSPIKGYVQKKADQYLAGEVIDPSYEEKINAFADALQLGKRRANYDFGKAYPDEALTSQEALKRILEENSAWSRKLKRSKPFSESDLEAMQEPFENIHRQISEQRFFSPIRDMVGDEGLERLLNEAKLREQFNKMHNSYTGADSSFGAGTMDSILDTMDELGLPYDY